MRGKRPVVVIALILAVAGATIGQPTAFAQQRGCQVEVDRECIDTPSSTGDQAAGGVVTTGVQFPGVASDSVLGRATQANSSCVGCEWTVTPACSANLPGEMNMCANAVQACAAPAISYRVYLRRPGGPWVFVSTVCLGPGQRPRAVADVGEAVREEVLSLLPDAAPTFQPAEGGLVNLPTLFAAGEPGSMTTESFDVLGFRVVVTATARWEWVFEPGVVQSFDKPGGPYPDQDVAYTYNDQGERTVGLTTFWSATFTVDGDGPFQVPGGEIAKTAAPLPVPVRQARSELVGG